MGGRLSMPRGPAGTTEISRPTRPAPKGRINSRTIVAPAAAFTMACLLFVYTRTSIRAAKANAQRHRDADGGQGLDLLNESRRRHGQIKSIDEGIVGGLASQAREQIMGKSRKVKEEEDKRAALPSRSPPEDKLKAAMSKRRDED